MISVSRLLSHYARPQAWRRLIVPMCIVTLAANAGSATAPGETPPTVAAPGLLWKIETGSEKPSYAFGTIHVADPRVTRLPPPVRDALDGAAILILEIVPDLSDLGQLTHAMLFTDGRTLDRVVGSRIYAGARAAFAAHGLPLEGFERYKPWAVMLMLSMPGVAGIGTDGDLPLDLALQQRAMENGQRVEGLETMQEQVAVFDELALDDQQALLEQTLRDQRKLPDRIETVIRAYLARDLGALKALSEQDEITDRALAATVTRRLLTDRNRRMVARMRPWLRRGNAFIAVGAAHLPGSDGILELLRREGFHVRAVY